MEEQYKVLVELLLNSLGIHTIDEKIEESNLLFGTSKHYKKTQLNSNYVTILNKFDTSSLTEEEKEKMRYLKTIEEAKEYIKHTLKKVTNKGYIMEPIKEIPKNTLVLEILVGPNKEKIKGQEFIENMNKQKEFLIDLQKKKERELTRALNFPVILYHNKEV